MQTITYDKRFFNFYIIDVIRDSKNFKILMFSILYFTYFLYILSLFTFITHIKGVKSCSTTNLAVNSFHKTASGNLYTMYSATEIFSNSIGSTSCIKTSFNTTDGNMVTTDINIKTIHSHIKLKFGHKRYISDPDIQHRVLCSCYIFWDSTADLQHSFPKIDKYYSVKYVLSDNGCPVSQILSKRNGYFDIVNFHEVNRYILYDIESAVYDTSLSINIGNYSTLFNWDMINDKELNYNNLKLKFLAVNSPDLAKYKELALLYDSQLPIRSKLVPKILFNSVNEFSNKKYGYFTWDDENPIVINPDHIFNYTTTNLLKCDGTESLGNFYLDILSVNDLITSDLYRDNNLIITDPENERLNDRSSVIRKIDPLTLFSDTYYALQTSSDMTSVMTTYDSRWLADRYVIGNLAPNEDLDDNFHIRFHTFESFDIPGIFDATNGVLKFYSNNKMMFKEGDKYYCYEAQSSSPTEGLTLYRFEVQSSGFFFLRKNHSTTLIVMYCGPTRPITEVASDYSMFVPARIGPDFVHDKHIDFENNYPYNIAGYFSYPDYKILMPTLPFETGSTQKPNNMYLWGCQMGGYSETSPPNNTLCDERVAQYTVDVKPESVDFIRVLNRLEDSIYTWDGFKFSKSSNLGKFTKTLRKLNNDAIKPTNDQYNIAQSLTITSPKINYFVRFESEQEISSINTPCTNLVVNYYCTSVIRKLTTVAGVMLNYYCKIPGDIIVNNPFENVNDILTGTQEPQEKFYALAKGILSVCDLQNCTSISPCNQPVKDEILNLWNKIPAPQSNSFTISGIIVNTLSSIWRTFVITILTTVLYELIILIIIILIYIIDLLVLIFIEPMSPIVSTIIHGILIGINKILLFISFGAIVWIFSKIWDKIKRSYSEHKNVVSKPNVSKINNPPIRPTGDKIKKTTLEEYF